MVNKDINDYRDYEYETYDTCMLKGCGRIVEWWLDKELGVGLCDMCYAQLEEGELKIE